MPEIQAAIEHPERRQLNDEVHARPPDNLPTPCALTYVARMPKETRKSPQGVATAMLEDLLRRYETDVPPADVKHYTATLDGGVRMRWERHTEYSRYTFVSATEPLDSIPAAADVALPADWLGQMRGEILVGVHAAVVEIDNWQDDVDALSRRYFDGNTLIGSIVADGRAAALTDLRIGPDGFSRLLLINDGMPEPQAGRFMQRLLEVETYRMMALLALPVAQQLMPALDDVEQELTAIGEALVDAGAQQEPELLDRITRLSASTQHSHLRSNYRFAASDAYYEIVLQRISELREQRILGLQTFEEFTTRRLTPAVKTYRAVSKRQQSILEQMARATKLLSTRIDVERQRQNQSLLASMNRRVKAQLRLQATVEGLSVAAVTYYLVGLVGTLAQGVAAMGVPLHKELVMGASIPVIAATAYLGIRRLRRKIEAEGSD